MKAGGLNPFTQALIFKSFCLSKSLYGLEIMSLNKKTINLLNMEQHTLIRFMIGLSKYCHMSDLMVVLRVLNMGELVTFYKLTFMKNPGGNEVCKLIFDYLVVNLEKYQKCNLSFARDLMNLTKFFKNNIQYIYDNIVEFIKNFKADVFSYELDNDAFYLIVNSLNHINEDDIRFNLNKHLMNLC
jgi:hypothetical protein